MRTIIIFLALVVSFSCNKESEDNLDIFFNAKLNGVQMDVLTPFAEMKKNDSIYSLELYSGTNDLTKLLFFSIFSNNIPTNGSYINHGECDFISECDSYMLYSTTNWQAEQFQFSSGENTLAESNVEFSVLEYKIGGRVKGTFSGILFNEDTGEKLEVTEGSFNFIIE